MISSITHKILSFVLRFLPGVIIVSLLLLVLPISTYAIGVNPKFDIMGVTCGIPGTPPINKCCAKPKVDFDLKVPNVNLGGNKGFSFNPIDIAKDAVGGVINLGVSAPINAVSEVFETVIEFTANSIVLKMDSGPLGNFVGKRTACFGDSEPSTTDPSSPSCVCKLTDDKSLTSILSLCAQTSPDEREQCQACVLGQNGQNAGVWTGIGCVPSNLGLFIQQTLLGWAIGIAGLLALLCILYASFMLQLSGGNPERVKKAREYLTSCIVGLLLIIFSVFILQVVGVNILRIPGFSGGP